jgi:DNA-binding NarL/FixJ family response regulator
LSNTSDKLRARTLTRATRADLRSRRKRKMRLIGSLIPINARHPLRLALRMLLTTRVAVVCDDVFFREGLHQLLRDHPAIAIVDHDPQPPDETAPAPDVLLVDSRREDSLDLCRLCEPDGPPYVILLMVPNETVAVAALGAGARGIVRTSDAIADAIRAISVVHAGSIWAPRSVIVEAWLRQRRGDPVVAERLSAREYEIVQSVASGMSNKELAEHYGISKATVKAHLTHVFQKLGLNGRGELIATYHGTSVPRNRSSHQAMTSPSRVVRRVSSEGTRRPR